jgi:hypothetical protein
MNSKDTEIWQSDCEFGAGLHDVKQRPGTDLDAIFPAQVNGKVLAINFHEAVPHFNFERGGVLFQRKILHVMLTICAAALSAASGVRAQQNYAVITQDGVGMKTRDGVKLYADIYRPKAEGKFPVILMRTPYDKSTGWAVGPAYEMAAHGYVGRSAAVFER